MALPGPLRAPRCVGDFLESPEPAELEERLGRQRYLGLPEGRRLVP